MIANYFGRTFSSSDLLGEDRKGSGTHAVGLKRKSAHLGIQFPQECVWMLCVGNLFTMQAPLVSLNTVGWLELEVDLLPFTFWSARADRELNFLRTEDN